MNPYWILLAIIMIPIYLMAGVWLTKHVFLKMQKTNDLGEILALVVLWPAALPMMLSIFLFFRVADWIIK